MADDDRPRATAEQAQADALVELTRKLDTVAGGRGPPGTTPHPLRTPQAQGGGARPQRVATCFALRAVDLLGHRPRIDRCVECGRAYPFPDASLDVGAGGLLCAGCGPGSDALDLSGATVGLLKRLRALGWEEGIRLPLAADLDGELTVAVEGMMGRLIGSLPRSSRFLTQTRRSLVHQPAP